MKHWLPILFVLFVSTNAFAQEEAPKPDAAAAEAPAPNGVERGSSFGVGPGLIFWSPPPSRSDWDLSLGLSIETRTLYLLWKVVGFEWTNDVTFHDWKAMGAAYKWYFTNTGDGDLQALKLALLWPGLFLIPFGGANYSTGFGVIVYTSPRVPALFFDVGAQLNLYLRLSDPDFRADFAIGAYGGGGFDFSETVGASLRIQWGSPLIHGLAEDQPRTVLTTLLNLKFAL